MNGFVWYSTVKINEDNTRLVTGLISNVILIIQKVILVCVLGIRVYRHIGDAGMVSSLQKVKVL